MMFNFIAQNRIHFKTRIFSGFFSQLPETRVLKFFPALEPVCLTLLVLTVHIYIPCIV